MCRNFVKIPLSKNLTRTFNYSYFHEGNHECHSGHQTSGVATRSAGGSSTVLFNFHFFLFLIHPTEGPDGGHKWY